MSAIRSRSLRHALKIQSDRSLICEYFLRKETCFLAGEGRKNYMVGKKTPYGRRTTRVNLSENDETVVSGGMRYKKSMVGDRLESRSVRSPRSANVTPADYADYLNSFGTPRARSGRSGKRGRGYSRGMAGKSGRRGKNELDTPPLGNPVRDVAAKYLPKFRVRLTVSIVSAIIVGLLVYHAFMSVYVEYATEKVTISPYLETIDVEGIAIRDEQPIEGSLSKNSVRVIQNGGRVSQGEAVVNIFSSESEASIYDRISEIDKEIEKLRAITAFPDDSANAVTLIGKQLDSKMVKLNAAAKRKNMSELTSLKEEISYLLNKRLVAMRQVENYNARIEQLENEKEGLEQKLTKEPKTINAPDSGYFSDSCDGYENLLNTSMVEELTVDQLDEIMKKEVTPPEKVIGKLVNSFSWYLACPVSAIDSDFLVKDYTYTLYLPYSDNESIQAVLYRLDKQEGQDRFLAIFRCSSLASELCGVRRQPVRIEKCRYEGFAIQKSALHAGVKDVIHKNEYSGDMPRGHLEYLTQTTYPSVYAIVAGQIKEKEVSIIYGTDEMVICQPRNGGDFLSVGDTVVIAERGLYNGKIIG